jgi:hypothetical protein
MNRSERAAAVVTWVYAAGFGVGALPVAIFLLRTGRLPMFFDWFAMYGGPWSRRLPKGALAALLLVFVALTLVTAWSAWMMWRGSRRGTVLNLVLLVPEAVFWIGFALPLPWLAAVARVALTASRWAHPFRPGPRRA